MLYISVGTDIPSHGNDGDDDDKAGFAIHEVQIETRTINQNECMD